jgi:hypothetical protein
LRTLSLTAEWVFISRTCLSFVKYTYHSHNMLMKMFPFTIYISSLSVQALRSRSCLPHLSYATAAAESPERSQASQSLSLSILYRMFNHRGNGICSVQWMERFSATTVPFPASESAIVRWYPHISFCTCTHL